MPLHHNFLAGAYYPIKLFRDMARPLGWVSQDNLRVLLYHDIAPEDHERFESQLKWLSRTWSFITPEMFSEMVAGQMPIRGRNLLITFDDGFASNRVIAEKVLNPMGIKALFFVVSDFIDLVDRNEARCFIAKHILPGSKAEDLPSHWKNMEWADLEALLEMGHTIGAHTSTHARLSDLLNESDLEREIIGGADKLQSRLGVPIDHFAYTYGNLSSFSETALAVAKRRFRFIYSGLRGDNSNDAGAFSLRRDASAMQDTCLNYSIYSNNLLGAVLEGVTDFHYAKYRTQLDLWCSAIT